MGMDTLIGLASLAVGLAGAAFSFFAWRAAKNAATVATETRDRIGQVRFSVEIDKLRRKVEDLQRSIRLENWTGASEKCTEATILYNEVLSRFDPVPEPVQEMEFLRYRKELSSIGNTCAALHAGKARSIPNLIGTVDEQIAFLSEVYGRSHQEVENQLVKRR